MMMPLSDSSILFGAEQGFLHLDLTRLRRMGTPAPAIVTRVAQGQNDPVVLDYLYQPARKIIVPPGRNHLTLSYSSPTYGGAKHIAFASMIEGLDKQWSDWTFSRERQFVRLPHGTYTFWIKARSQYGLESEPTSVTLVIQAPWYASVWAKVLLVLFFLGTISVLFRKQKKTYEQEKRLITKAHQKDQERQRQVVLDTEQELARIKNEKLEAEIAHQNKELALATMHLVQKGAIMSMLQHELKDVANQTTDRDAASLLMRLIHKLQIDEQADQDWEAFEIRFDKVHGDFIKRLGLAYPHLTPYELRMSAFLYLDLSTKEIAQLLNITVRGVETSRHRLRKKLGVAHDVNLATFMKQI
jgi:DNA-binding CsgD family transcriptional regulator/cbb3-type cytochrome oxidase subunit 3